MMNHAVQLDIDEFRDAFLPTFSRPTRLRTTEISPLFVESLAGTSHTPGSSISFFQPGSSSPAKNESSLKAALFRGHYTTRSRRQPWWADQRIPIEFKSPSPGIDPFDTTPCYDEYGSTERRRREIFDDIAETAHLLFAAQHRVFVFMLLIIGRQFRLIRWDHGGVIVTPSIDYYQEFGVLCDLLWRLSHLDDVALGFDPSATRILPGKVDHLKMDMHSVPHRGDIDHKGGSLLDFGSGKTPVFEYVRSLFKASLTDDWPRYKLEVPDGEGVRHFLIGKPSFVSHGLFGRGTRGYVALDCTTNRFVWLKDTWRASLLFTDTEGDIVHQLNEAGIDNVPTLICHGDILNQATTTADWWERQRSRSSFPAVGSSTSSHSSSRESASRAPLADRKRKRAATHTNGNDETTAAGKRSPTPDALAHTNCPLQRHMHYRVAFEEVCLPLKKFVNGHQLGSVVLDGIRTHYQATTHPKIRRLHRDISSGNLLILPKIKRGPQGRGVWIAWTGVLSDWEMSKPIEGLHETSKASRVSRTGTYQFMSVNLLLRPSEYSSVPDELESFFHVLLYHAVRHLRSSCDDPWSWIDQYFNNYSGPNRMYTCGKKSIAIEVTGELETLHPEMPLLFDSPLDIIFTEMLTRFKARYKVLNYDFSKAALPPVSPAISEPPESLPSPYPIYMRPPRVLDEEDARIQAEIAAELANWTPPDNTPSAEERRLASELADHVFVLGLFERVLRDADWPEDDRLPSLESPPAAPGANAPALGGDVPCMPPRKRQRTGPPARNATLPTRLHASTRRTRSQARAALPRTRSKS
ncbi:hypothetical protein BD309DRAFT_900258 [Dichomitus squalens]|uniref:Fungal-type protein kinase domain-containing protein n=1 Tax=Dichomitus squalens TaxID=114155 RepID=A0A4Q9NIF6_9APHY|nr:hypothetical protein BD309DRAFT_900258 [Dichomitus squalens]TBU56973.1 hypothetical protein BD310DRAFT_853987 [Dichomitus squalens]